MFPSGVEVKNRLVLAPMTTNSGTADGGLSLEDKQFILKRSEDFGMIILGSHSISSTGSAFKHGWNIYNHKNWSALTELTEILHQKDIKVIVQIYHAGRLAQPEFINGSQPIAPSRIPAKRDFSSYPKAMTLEEIHQAINDFSSACEIAIDLGLDGVELHGANTYLLQQFYSPHSNRREDEWGGNLKKRMKFLMKVIGACRKAIQKKAKKPFILGYRFSPEELESPGIRMTDTKLLLKELTKLQLDYIHISLNNYRKISQEGKSIIQELNTLIPPSVPFIGCGNIQTAEEVNELVGLVPLVSVGKAVLTDPLWAKKIISGKEDMQTFIGIKDRKKLAIPLPLWESMCKTPLVYFSSVIPKEVKK